jgi:hypothetical protein
MEYKELENIDHIRRDAEEYGKLVADAFMTCSKKKKNTPMNRVKIPLKNVTESVTVARLLGELCAVERVLSAIKNDIKPEDFSTIEEYKDNIVGDLQIFVMGLNNLIARRVRSKTNFVTLEDVVEER